ncbi:MAG: hypothetical protein Q8Q60_01905 [Candidatus Chromulinivorax sp.]|nr:hypothetical protein [Candidatus Chromulinivorax sp.]
MSCISLFANQPNQQSNQSNDNSFIAEDNNENMNNNTMVPVSLNVPFDMRRIARNTLVNAQSPENIARVDQIRRDILDRGLLEVNNGIMPRSRNTSGSPVPTDNNN